MRIGFFIGLLSFLRKDCPARLKPPAYTKILTGSFFTCSQETLRTNTFSFDTECVLLAGNNANGIYPLKYFHGKFDAYQRTYVLIPLSTDLLLTRYLYYALRPKLSEFRSFSTGAATKFLTMSILNATEIPLPSRPVQLRITDVLSAYDELIENCERRIRVLDEMARALYREWFVLFRFPGHEKTPLVDSPLGRIPKTWAVTPASHALMINPKVSLPRDGARPFVPMGSLSNDTMLISEIETRNVTTGAKFQNGDTLLARITPCLENGKTGFVQFLPDADSAACGSTEFIVLRGRSVPPQYVYCLARSAEFRQHAIKSMSGATGRQRVQEACFSRFFLAQPPVELLRRFEDLVRPSFELSQVFHLRIETLRLTRDLLLPRLLSGQLTVEAA